MDENDLLMLALLANRRRRAQAQAPRSVWVREPLLERQRHGEYQAMAIAEHENPDEFYSAYRMIPERFDELLISLTPRLERQNTNYRFSIPPAERLALTIR